jgi:hypothetical protein
MLLACLNMVYSEQTMRIARHVASLILIHACQAVLVSLLTNTCCAPCVVLVAAVPSCDHDTVLNPTIRAQVADVTLRSPSKLLVAFRIEPSESISRYICISGAGALSRWFRTTENSTHRLHEGAVAKDIECSIGRPHMLHPCSVQHCTNLSLAKFHTTS